MEGGSKLGGVSNRFNLLIFIHIRALLRVELTKARTDWIMALLMPKNRTLCVVLPNASDLSIHAPRKEAEWPKQQIDLPIYKSVIYMRLLSTLKHLHSPHSTRLHSSIHAQQANLALICRRKDHNSRSLLYTLTDSATSNISHLRPLRPSILFRFNSRDNCHGIMSWQKQLSWVTPASNMKNKKWLRENRKASYSLDTPLSRNSRRAHDSLKTNSLNSLRMSICSNSSKGSSKKWRTKISRRMSRNQLPPFSQNKLQLMKIVQMMAVSRIKSRSISVETQT